MSVLKGFLIETLRTNIDAEYLFPRKLGFKNSLTAELTFKYPWLKKGSYFNLLQTNLTST